MQTRCYGCTGPPIQEFDPPRSIIITKRIFSPQILLLFIIIIIAVSGRTLSKNVFCITLSYNVSVWIIISLWDESLKELAPFFMIIWTKYNLCC